MRWTAIAMVLLAATAARGQDMPLSQVLLPGEGWHEVKLPAGSKPALLAADDKGRVFVADGDGKRILRAGPGPVTIFARPSSAVGGLCVDRNGVLHASQPDAGRIVTFDGEGREKELRKAKASDLAICPSGLLYFIDPDKKAVFLAGRKEPVAEGFIEPAGLVFWRDGGTLVVGDAGGRHLYAFRLRTDGTLDARERYHALRVRPRQPSRVRGLALDSQGRLYAATAEGVQVFDPTGRLSGVLNRPVRQPVTAVAFAGRERDRLFIICGGKLWQRRTKTKAAWPPS